MCSACGSKSVGVVRTGQNADHCSCARSKSAGDIGGCITDHEHRLHRRSAGTQERSERHVRERPSAYTVTRAQNDVGYVLPAESREDCLLGFGCEARRQRRGDTGRSQRLQKLLCTGDGTAVSVADELTVATFERLVGGLGLFFVSATEVSKTSIFD